MNKDKTCPTTGRECEPTQYAPYQKCPKCDGQGTVSKPLYVPGDVFNWSESTGLVHQCDVCNGAKIIPMFPITPQQQL